MKLTTAAREYYELSEALEAHIKASREEESRLRHEIEKRLAVLNMAEAGIDTEKVALAETILIVSDYSLGGADRESARLDAIKQLSTGKPIRPHYGDLWKVYFGTKNYDRWHGQRCDCEYGYGPRHGSICFTIRITEQARKRGQDDLTADEVEAAIYYLLNLERIQEAARKAKQAA